MAIVRLGLLSIYPLEQIPISKREMIRDHLAVKFYSCSKPTFPNRLKIALYPMRARLPAIWRLSTQACHLRQRAKEQIPMLIKLIESEIGRASCREKCKS